MWKKFVVIIILILFVAYFGITVLNITSSKTVEANNRKENETSERFIVNKWPNKTENNFSSASILIDDERHSTIPLVIAVCHKVSEDHTSFFQGGLFREVTVLLKSIAISTKNARRIIIIFNEISVVIEIQKYLNKWPVQYQKKLEVEYTTFKPRPECMKEFKLCQTVILFFHEIFPQEDAVVAVDADFIFLENPEKVIDLFKQFDDKQFIGGSTDTFYKTRDNLSEDYPFYGLYGLQAGLLLLNLTRIRNFQYNWTNLEYAVCQSYKGRFRSNDQGVLNLLLSETYFETIENFQLGENISNLMHRLEKNLQLTGEFDQCKNVR